MEPIIFLGMKVILIKDFQGYPAGTTGKFIQVDHQIMVGLDLPQKPVLWIGVSGLRAFSKVKERQPWI